MKLVKIERCDDCGAEEVLGYRFPSMADLCPFCYACGNGGDTRQIVAQMMNTLFLLLRRNK